MTGSIGIRRQHPRRLFTDRREAGQVLAGLLAAYRGRPDVVVLGLARGGLPVAVEVARSLDAPLDAFIVRKLGAPGHEEFAIGALASGGRVVINDDVIRGLHITPRQLREIIDRESAELIRREAAYRGGRTPLDVAGKTVILVDDGIATGSTMQAAIASLRQRQVERIVVATPVAAPSVLEILRQLADEVVCAMTPEDFRGVGQWYDDFSQTSDEEVHFFLSASAPEATHLQLLTS